jgi:hypothetical protein
MRDDEPADLRAFRHRAFAVVDDLLCFAGLGDDAITAFAQNKKACGVARNERP